MSLLKMFNIQNKEGHTPLHLCMTQGMPYEIVLRMCPFTDLRLRDGLGKSVFHLAARNYHALLQTTELLLKHGADVNDIDNQGSSILHEVFKNSAGTLKVVETLLKSGAVPDRLDGNGFPPLSYCANSTLEVHEKRSAERMLIQYSVIKKITRDDPQPEELDAAVSFHFCQDSEKRLEWEEIRHRCITDMLKMKKVYLKPKYTFLQFLTDYSNNPTECLTSCSLKTILWQLKENEYPGLRSMIISAIENCDFKEVIEDLISLDISLKSTTKCLSLDCIRGVFEFLPRKDLINFILALS